MSGHNPPHGRLGQPNSTWNPLQVPSYIPRQPQLAHMSSERSMARSPLTWHTPPNHQDQLYNFMSANHKNNLEINPILPTFGRGSGMPLGSVDLSLSSAARSTPSPKGGNSLQGPAPPPLGPGSLPPSSNIPPGMGPMPEQNDHFHHKMIPGQQHHHMNANHNRSAGGSSSQIGGVIQSTAALKDRSGLGNNGGTPPSCSFLGPAGGVPPQHGQSGGNGYYNMMSSNSSSSTAAASINNRPPPPAGPVGGVGGGGGAGLHGMPPMGGPAADFGGLHIKDAKQLNSEVGKNGRDNIPGGFETADHVRDMLLHAMQRNQLSMSPKRNSSLQTPVPPGQSPTRSRSPPAGSSSAAMLLPGMDGILPTVAAAKSFPLISANVPSTTEAVPDVASGTTKDDHRSPLQAPPESTSPAVLPASLPAATDRISPSQSVTSNDDSADSNSSKSRRRRKPDRTSKMSTDELERMHDFLTSENSADKCDRIDGIDPMRPNIAVRNDIATLALEGISSLSQGLASDSSHSPHITDLSDSTRINLHTATATLNESNNSNAADGRRKSPAAVSSVISSVLSAAAAIAAAAASSESARKDSESASDDCETIDKIAAMISSTEDDGVGRLAATDPAVGNCNGPAAQEATVPVGDGSSSSGSSKPESQHKPDADKSYEEIENKLEEMFAGIEESMPSCSKSSPAKKSPSAKPNSTEPATDILTELAGKTESESTSAGSNNSPAQVEGDISAEPGTSGTQKKILTPAAKRANAGKAAAGTPPNKRKKVLKKKSAHGKGTSFAAAEERMANFAGGKGAAGKKPLAKGKKPAAGSTGGKNAKVKSNDAGAAGSDPNGKYKGPFVQVKTDGSHLVINAPINEDDSDKPQNKTKKFANSMNNSERSKIRGLHVSTLSTKYDADTTDASWMCVFCKTGPHKMRLGDLFGPYIISTKSNEFAESKTDEDFFSDRRTRESLASKLIPKVEPQAAAGSSAKSKKRKLTEPTATTSQQPPSTATTAKVPPTPEDMFNGMVKAGSDSDSYEVWMHEDCLAWAPGVYIIGTRIVGLEAAIWNCCRHQCRICLNYGAMVSCLRRGCNAEAHVVCARKHDWELSDEFKAHCEDHSEPAEDS